MKSDVPKQFMNLGDFPVLYYSLKTFQDSQVDEIVLVAGADSTKYCQAEIVDKYNLTKVKKIVPGGGERFNSVYNGLAACDDPDLVLIHDGARPFVTKEMIDASVNALEKFQGCAVGVPVKDTIKVVDENGICVATPDRATLWQVQTPQSFRYEDISAAYKKMFETLDHGLTITDDTMVFENFGGGDVAMIEGSYTNIKITTPEDMDFALAYISNRDRFK